MATSAPYYPNYAYVGPPTVYNGTGNTGGDSGMNFQFLPPFNYYSGTFLKFIVKNAKFNIKQPSKI
jgi:hypothetical protein